MADKAEAKTVANSTYIFSGMNQLEQDGHHWYCRRKQARKGVPLRYTHAHKTLKVKHLKCECQQVTGLSLCNVETSNRQNVGLKIVQQPAVPLLT